MLLLLSWVVLSLFAGLMQGRVAPSVPYAKATRLNSVEKQLKQLPYNDLDEGSAAGSAMGLEGDTALCSSSFFERTIYQMKSFAYKCVDKLQFENCCEPKFLRYDWLGSNIYPIRLSGKVRKIDRLAYCDMETDGGGWLVLLRRGSRSKLYQDFLFRDFKHGFGKLDRDFWLGLENMHDLTHREARTELRVELARRGETRLLAQYDQFTVGNESTGYSMTVAGYRSDISSLPDSLSHSNGFPFVTIFPSLDSPRPEVRAQYVYSRSYFCTSVFSGSWWYGNRGNESCTRVSLLGFTDAISEHFRILWEVKGKKKGFDFVEMKIRPKKWECGVNQYSEEVVKQAILAQQLKSINNPFQN